MGPTWFALCLPFVGLGASSSFYPVSSALEASHMLLILDGHYSHTQNLITIDLASTNFALILFLAPNSLYIYIRQVKYS
jgi:hypothetical protein